MKYKTGRMDPQTIAALQGKKALVTGGTGFIGGRLVEKLLLECEARVRVLVRDFSKASRLARFPVEMAAGDMADETAVAEAVEGCDLVFHCAHDPSGTASEQMRLALRSAKNMALAVLHGGAKRLVHVSTISVYGDTRDGDLDETAPRMPTYPYGKAKLAGEQLILDYCQSHGLPATVIQPTIVYGPYCKPWTLAPVEQLLSGRDVVLVNGGHGYCNAVYVDDVVNAMILASVPETAVGETFLVSYEQPVTWRDFYGAYEDLLGVQATTSLSAEELMDIARRFPATVSDPGNLALLGSWLHDPHLWGQLRRLPALRRVQRIIEARTPFDFTSWFKSKVVGDLERRAASGSTPSSRSIVDRVHMPSEERIHLCAAKTHVRIDKARRVLGHEPVYDLARGMESTGQFVHWYYSL